MSATSQSKTAPTKTKLGETVAFPNSAEYLALSPQRKNDYIRNDALGHGYAWGRLDQGHPPIVAVNEGDSPSNTDTAWAFGSLYAQMLLELHDPEHPRLTAFSVQDAWDVFAKTGCPEGHLPSSGNGIPVK